MRKGFTLVELLVVMGILAILMSAVVVGIDPLDKLESAKDSKVQQDMTTVATAMEAYAAGHAGAYPCPTAGTFDTAGILASGDLKAIPVAPSGRTYDYSLCTAASGAMASRVTSKKFVSDTKSPFYIANSGTVYWVWCASSGKAASMASIACP